MLCGGCTAADAPRPSPPPAAAAQPRPVSLTFAVQLVDGKTRAILAGVTATVTSPHGSWEGRADAEGGVHVPADIVADEMVVAVQGYKPATVQRNVGRRPKRVVTVRLVPQ
jgi:hypothetical protein